MTAMPRSRASGRMRASTSRSTHVVGDLHEIDRLVRHDPLDLGVAAAFGGGDPDIAQLPIRLHGEQRLEVPLPGDQIVHLEQIEPRHAPVRARLLDLIWPDRRRVRDPDLVGREHARSDSRACAARSRSSPARSHTSARSRSCLPPASKKAAITAAHSSWSTRSSPTLKVIQLPRPTTGNGSPVDGIGLVISRWCCAARQMAGDGQRSSALPPGRRERRAASVRGSGGMMASSRMAAPLPGPMRRRNQRRRGDEPAITRNRRRTPFRAA